MQQPGFAIIGLRENIDTYWAIKSTLLDAGQCAGKISRAGFQRTLMQQPGFANSMAKFFDNVKNKRQAEAITLWCTI